MGLKRERENKSTRAREKKSRPGSTGVFPFISLSRLSSNTFRSHNLIHFTFLLVESTIKR